MALALGGHPIRQSTVTARDVDAGADAGSVARRSNVLDYDRQHEIRALGGVGWTLSRFQEATGVRRETMSSCQKAAGIPVRGRGRPSDSNQRRHFSGEVSTDLGPSKPAIAEEVSTHSEAPTVYQGEGAPPSLRSHVLENAAVRQHLTAGKRATSCRACTRNDRDCLRRESAELTHRRGCSCRQALGVRWQRDWLPPTRRSTTPTERPSSGHSTDPRPRSVS